MTYARIAAAAATPPEKLPDEPGFRDGYLLEPDGSGSPLVLSLWEHAGDADHELIEDWAGPTAGDEARSAVVLSFDGPISPARFDAAQFAARERIQPALAAVPGVVRMLTLWEPQTRSACVVNLAVSADALEAASRAVNATTLLPGEDPALLPGPDRGATYHVTRIPRGRP